MQRREDRLRDRARRQRLAIRRSRVRTPNSDDLGGYQLVDIDHNVVIGGSHFEYDLDDVEERLSALELPLL